MKKLLFGVILLLAAIIVVMPIRSNIDDSACDRMAESIALGLHQEKVECGR